MCVGRGKQQHRIDGRIGENRVDVVGHGETVGVGKSLPTLGAWTKGCLDLDALLQILKAPGMRRCRHAEADYADLFHTKSPPEEAKIASRKSSYNICIFVC